MSIKIRSFAFYTFTTLVFLSLLFSATGVTPARAANLVVTKTADTNDGACNSDCSLREAITAAVGGDTITFDASLAGLTINLGSELTINKSLVIDGSALASQISISGQNAVRVFFISPSTTVVTLNSLKIINGSVSYGGPDTISRGGGIINRQSTLTLINCTVSGNQAPAIWNSSAGGLGGGIYSTGPLTIINSTIANNIASNSGGGVYADYGIGGLTVSNSTFSGNSAPNSDNDTVGGYGGAVYARYTTTIVNSTFSGNTSRYGGGAIHNEETTLTLRNTTISGNSTASYGSGLYNNGQLYYTNNIIANNTGGGWDCMVGGSPWMRIEQNSNNLVGSTNCGAPAYSGDPLLGALAYNGGATQTMALLAGSPALNVGSGCQATDQRGITRPQGPACDIGAYEKNAQAGPNFVVNTAYDVNDGFCDAYVAGITNCSLREAIAAASSGSIITFDSSLSGATINLFSQLTLSQNMTIDGSALATRVTLSGQWNTLIFYTNMHTVTLNSLRMILGHSSNIGGAIVNDGTLTLVNSILDSNYAVNDGGGIYNAGTLNITNSFLAGNSAGRYGGGIANYGAVTVANSTLRENQAPNGGGVFNAPGVSNLTMTNSTLWRNMAPSGSGGGVSNYGTLAVTNSTISDGAAIFGGGIFQGGGGVMSLANNILANSGTDCWANDGIVSSSTNNLIEVDAGGFCGAALNGDPLLGALQDNGGPTLTMALGAGSPAIDAGSDAICAAAPVNALDQRGVERPQGSHCDIGAYEVDVPPTLLSFTRQNPLTSPTGADTLVFRATFNESVQNVSTGDFAVNGATTAGVSLVTQVSAKIYDITVSGGDLANFNGVVGLNLNGAQNITDLTGNALPASEPTIDETYALVNNRAPTDISLSNNIVAENQPAGALVGTLTTTDPDTGDTHTYSLPGGVSGCNGADNASFQISGNQLQTAAVFVYATKSTYYVCVRTTDSGGLTYAEAYTIQVMAANAITAFTIPGQTGGSTINEGAGTIAVLMPYGTNVTALVPAITHTGTSVNPPSGVAQDFTNPVVYTVTRIDGSTKSYTVTVTVALNPAKAITAFTIPDQVGNTTINEPAGTIGVSVPYGTNVTALVPTITHTGASVTPASGVAQNFTNPVVYTVTAADGSTKAYTVTVTILPCVSNPTVANANDSGVGSLRRAISESCAGSTITFGGDYTIPLLSTLTIGKNLTIDGVGHAVTVSGQNTVRVFVVNGGVTATLNNLTIANGNTGGGGAGGGINNGGTLTVANSTLISNSANAGGGIYNYANLTVTNSTLSDNHAGWGENGGGIYNESTGTVTLLNSTFSGNRADWGGGSIFNVGTLNYANTIFANSIVGGGGLECFNYGGTIGVNTNNLVEGGTCFAAISDDPQLGALGNYGGNTQTFPLLPGSPAINAGASCTATDQRGKSRIGTCDIGSFESGGFTLAISGGNNQTTLINTAFANPLQVTISSNASPVEPVDSGTVTFTAPGSGASAAITGSPAAISGGSASVTATANGTDGAYTVSANTSGTVAAANFSLANELSCYSAITVANNADSGTGSLRRAITKLCTGGTITFGGDYSIGLLSTLTIDKNMTIDGTGHTVTVSGQNAVRVFIVNNSITASLQGLTIANGNTDSGGGILNYGTLTVENSAISGCHASWAGGGIYNESGSTLTVLNSTLSGNASDNYGGGIFNSGGTAVTSSTLSANSATYGGGIYSNNSLAVTNSTFIGNIAYLGGGIHNTVLLTVSNSTFANNSVTDGGGIFNDTGGTLTLTNSTFSGNSASWAGGSLFLQTGSTLNYSNNILANSTLLPATTGAECANNGGSVVSANNLVEDGTCAATIMADPQLGSLGNYGGNTQTFPLLPGSPAINAGASCPTTDQRGKSRVGGGGSTPLCDIGSFESGGFTLAISGGNNQTTLINTAFANPLQVTISSNASPVEPVDGGTVTFTAPGSGASAVITGSPAAISGGSASVTATANGTDGAYTVSANTSGAAAAANFSLINDVPCYTAATVTNNADDGTGSLRRAMTKLCAGGTITFNGDYTILLGSALIIDKNMTINGAGHSIVVNGQGNVRGFVVNSGVTAALNALTIVNGSSGVAGGGIYNNHAILTVTNSTLTDNFGAQGGGIFNDFGTMTIANCTLTNNTAEWSGGGVYNYNGTLTMLNNTLSGNRTNQTYGYGGGFYNYGTLHFSNTIIANSPHGADCVHDGGLIATNLNNLVEDGGCSSGGVNFKTGDPQLAATLASNGGSTQTFALLSNSPVIDAGDAATCAAAPVSGQDQRGQARSDWQCDIGAFELKLNDSTSVAKAISGAGTFSFGPTMVKIVVNDAGPGGCLTGITIQRYDVSHPNATTPLNTGHWWEITPTGCASGFNVALTLPTDFTPDDKDLACRWNPAGQWDCAMSSFTTSGILSITRNNVTGFSQWAAGNNAGPTAITLTSLAAHNASRPLSVWGISGLAALVCFAAITWRKRRVR